MITRALQGLDRSREVFELSPSNEYTIYGHAYKATNYKLLVSRPGETMESMRAGSYYYLILFRI